MELESNCQWHEVRGSTGAWQGLPSSSSGHQCPHCPYNTTESNKLKRHILKHTGEKPFSCPYCSYRAARKELLKDHINIHTGERPYTCPYCPYSSSRKNILKVHIRRHTGEKPYACVHCPYRAAQKSNLNNHLLTHKMSDSDLHWKGEEEGNVKCADGSVIL